MGFNKIVFADIKVSLRTFAWILSAGILMRLTFALLFAFRFSGPIDILVSLLLGLVFDTGFAAVILFIFMWLDALHERSAKIFLSIVVALWLVLNAFDLFSFNYLGARVGFKSFNLFSLSDITGKFKDADLKWPFLIFVVAFSALFYYSRSLIVPSFSKNITARIFASLFFFALSLIYLPFPLNYYSDQVNVSKEARQLAVNPFHSWSVSLLEQNEKYPMEINVAAKLLGLKVPLDNASIARNVNYNDSAFTNVILIVMESFGANCTGALKGEVDLTPNFNRLCKEGELYTKCFACGPRTQYGISSILFGFDHILRYNLFRENRQKLPFHGLPRLLQNEFEFFFLHGGKANYDDMDLLISSDHDVKISDMNSIDHYKFKNSWGIDDESLFDFSANFIEKRSGKNFYCILSMSNHEPHEIPSDYNVPDNNTKYTGSEKAFLYSDFALGKFIENLKKKGIYEKSLIIITGDHGEWHSAGNEDTKLNHVPLLTLDHKNKGKINKQVISHADIAEYILKKTGFKGKSHLLGINLVTAADNVYYRNYDDDLFKVTDSVIFKYNLKSGKLWKLVVSESMYVINTKELELSQSANRLVAEEIMSKYTVNRYLFENGYYRSGP